MVADGLYFLFEFLNLDVLPPSKAIFLVLDPVELMLLFEVRNAFECADFGDLDVGHLMDLDFKFAVFVEFLHFSDFTDFLYLEDLDDLDNFDRFNLLDLLIAIKSSFGEYSSSPSE